MIKKRKTVRRSNAFLEKFERKEDGRGGYQKGAMDILMQQKKFTKRHAFSLLPKPIGSEVQRLLSPFIKSQGFYKARVILDWDKIIGFQLSLHTQPQKISFPKGKKGNGTLVLLVASAFAPEIMHLSPQIIERINGYFGYGAIEKIVLKHGLIKKESPVNQASFVPGVALSIEETQELDDILQEISDGPLKVSLENLGKRIFDRASRSS